MTQEEALDLARRYKQSLQEARIPMSAFIVFGSVARNEMHDQSDVDIAVVGTSFKGDRLQEMHDIRKLRYPISYKLQPIWFYPEHLEDKYSTLAMEIKKDGIVV
ncbi:nucleotidyltransferase domain-containing protein [Candidatus Peregrinibacteria bacterium]|nr:nucleotidyltransferase domain-containing protein [Candidatus Peregrinibacteria bacterium]